MKIKCKKCGYEFETMRCRRCGKGVYEKKVYLLGDPEWRCTWCGDESITGSDDYNCPKCQYYNKDYNILGCFITTACVKSKGLEDNCYELTTIRSFRDNVMKKNEKLNELVTEYYQYAPMIVSAINALPDSMEIYNDIYDNMILPCISAIENKEDDKAISVYYNYYRKLFEKYVQ